MGVVDAGGCGILALAAALSLWQARRRDPLGADEGYLWYGVQQTLAGRWPHRDVKSYEPGRYLWSAAFARVFGGGLLPLRGAAHLCFALGLCAALLVLRTRGLDCPSTALAAFGDVITYWQQTGRGVHQLTTLRNLPALLHRVDAAEECATILGAVGREDVQPAYGEEATRLEADEAWACGRLGEEAFVRQCRAGAELDIEQAAEAALTIIDRVRQTRAQIAY